jgi:hypothetical protein
MLLIEPMVGTEVLRRPSFIFVDLLNQVLRGLSGQRGVLGPALAVGQVTVTAGKDLGRPAVGHHIRQRRVLLGKPVRHIEAVIDAGLGELGLGAGHMLLGRIVRLGGGGHHLRHRIGPDRHALAGGPSLAAQGQHAERQSA